MRRRTLLAAAAIGGLALAGGVLVARDGSPVVATTGTPATTASRPVIHLDPNAREPRLQEARGIASTAKIVARQPDPEGGPDWVLRRYERPAQHSARFPNRRAKTVRCAQLGRLVDGKVAWITPGGTRATVLPLGDAGTSSCTLTAPIAQRLGVQAGGLPDGVPGAATTRVRTAVVWGVVDRPVASASIEGSQFAGPVTIKDGAFLRVERAENDSAPPYVRLTVRDLDGGTRGAIPLGAYTDLPLPGRPKGSQQRIGDEPPADYGLSASGERFTAVAKLPADRLGVINALYATRVKGHAPCVTGPVPTIGGRPVQPSVGAWIGLVHEPRLTCAYVQPDAASAPRQIGGSGSLGVGRERADVVAADARARRIQRRPSAFSIVTVATPPGTRYLEVTSPVGVTTVRVTWARVTAVLWDGQREVLPEVRGRSLIERLRSGRTRRWPSLFTFRALDAQGKQLGAVGRSSY